MAQLCVNGRARRDAATADSAEIAEGERTTGTPKAPPLDSSGATPGEVNEGEEGKGGAFRIVNSWLSNFATADCGGGTPTRVVHANDVCANITSESASIKPTEW